MFKGCFNEDIVMNQNGHEHLNSIDPIGLTDEIDSQILMHRDAHFAGSFPVMIEYYEKGGRGVNPEFDLERIRRLALLELRTQQNLAPLLLTAAEAEKVASSRQMYKQLKSIYDQKPSKNNLAKSTVKLIADLVLTESQDPQKEIKAIVAEKGSIVSSLIELLYSEDLYNPLFPGYGQAPFLAAQCLGEIGDKRAIIALFESIGKHDFFAEEISLRALKLIGKNAQDFLLKVVQGHPYNDDNIKAASCLIEFKEDQEVGEICLKLLQEKEVKSNFPFATYLILGCSNLKNPNSQKLFQQLSDDALLPKNLKRDIQAIANSWKEEEQST